MIIYKFAQKGELKLQPLHYFFLRVYYGKTIIAGLEKKLSLVFLTK